MIQIVDQDDEVVCETQSDMDRGEADPLFAFAYF